MSFDRLGSNSASICRLYRYGVFGTVGFLQATIGAEKVCDLEQFAGYTCLQHIFFSIFQLMDHIYNEEKSLTFPKQRVIIYQREGPT